ncbi:uncharacterized protein PHACADRAFT_248882 [Phanerochaete carnosa HHB-10118-sp]|uniref:Uncharacterized protein n=1 Tax=Phanerochaete carnosa (strain HHB-10118-sp) TaxID=650164 RepID=K5W4J3_PHACS|nr:uncharacterized protein PHACADRAFT_248882 [Phanerochaete carnosa HHB-10118-sp]EKM58793.1 hypothetical protein PHACADRAFT_248882 [Phanerochaete carnosa HHB-10118-sp]
MPCVATGARGYACARNFKGAFKRNVHPVLACELGKAAAEVHECESMTYPDMHDTVVEVDGGYHSGRRIGRSSIVCLINSPITTARNPQDAASSAEKSKIAVEGRAALNSCGYLTSNAVVAPLALVACNTCRIVHEPLSRAHSVASLLRGLCARSARDDATLLPMRRV